MAILKLVSFAVLMALIIPVQSEGMLCYYFITSIFRYLRDLNTHSGMNFTACKI